MSTPTYKRMTEREYKNYQRKMRRERELRRKYLFAALSFVVILVCVFSLKSITSKAVDESDIIYKYFKTYEVANDDTLWSIAKEHIDYEYYDDVNEYIDEVVSINHLNGDTILYGQSIIIPYFSAEFR